jgi:protein TonB
MKSITLILLLSFFYANAIAQEKDTIPSLPDSSNEKGLIFIAIERGARFPGGDKKWSNFIQENLVYPKGAKRKKIEGDVVVKFIVEKDGSLSGIEAIEGPQELRQAAIDLLKKSPNWIPDEQGGRSVRSFQNRTIIFQSSKENNNR